MRQKNAVSKKASFILLIIALLYLVSRLWNLAILPIFFDEANYLFWAKQIASTNQHWFISLSAAKPFPLIWMIALFLKILPPELYLLAGRLPSVLLGGITLLGIYQFGKDVLRSKKVGLVAANLYVFLPFALFHDRMTLYDSGLAAMMIWTAVFVFKSARTLKVKYAIFWGIFLGLALLFKASALSYEILAPIAFIVVSQKLFLNLKRKVLLILTAFITSQLVANVYVVSSGYFEYFRKSLDYTPGAKTATTPIQSLFIPNVLLSWQWLSAYFTWPLFLFALVSLFFLLWKKPQLGVSFVLLAIVPIVGFSFLGRIYFPRYLLFTVPFFLISISYLICEISQRSKIFATVILVSLLILPLNFDRALLFNPSIAPFPEVDNWQYVSGYPSGYGLERIEKYVANESKTKPICLIVQGSFSHYPNAFFLEFWDSPNVYIEERWPLTEQDISDNQCFTARGIALQPIVLKQKPTEQIEATYFVLRNDEKANLINDLKTLGLKLVIEGKKPGEKDSVFLTQKVAD